MYSHPQSQGAYAHVDEKQGRSIIDKVLKDLRDKWVHFDDPLRLSVPYEYIAKRVIKPPDGLMYDLIAFAAIAFIFFRSILRGYIYLLYRLAKCRVRTWIKRMKVILIRSGGRVKGKGNEKHVCLTTCVLTKEKYALLAENVSEAYLTSWDTDGIYFCVDNCATCIICNEKSMFVGDLKPSNSEVLTSNGQNVPALEGTLRIVLEDDLGSQHQYDIPGVLYDPESPFNLLGLSFISASISEIKRLWVHALHRDAYSHTSFGTMENMNATSIMEWTVCLHCKSTKGKHFSSHFALESVDSMTTTSNSASGLKPESGLMQVYPNQGPPRNANIVIKTSRKVWN